MSAVFTDDREDLIRLDLNENYFLSDEFYEELQDDVEFELNRYPSEHGWELCEKLADHYGLKPEQFIVGNGSDSVLDTVVKTFVPKDGVLGYYEPTYAFYSFFASRNDRKVLEVPLRSDFTVPGHTEFMGEIDALIVCSPNNPTSIRVDENHLRSILEHDIPVVVDEAYAEFSSENCVPLLSEYSNLTVIRTFSKAWGLAGIRVGYAISNAQTIMELKEEHMPFNVNSMSMSLAMSALNHKDMMEDALQETFVQRDYLTEELEYLGFNVLPSETNFLFCRPPSGIKPGEIYSELMDREILVKRFDEERLRDFLRITVGTEEINEKLLDSLDEILR